MLSEMGWAAAVAVVSLLGHLLQGRTNFSDLACSRFEPFMNQYLVGQEASLNVVTDAVCDFLDPRLMVHGQDGASGHRGGRPLVLSIHGPPGVGKTYFHQLAARVLYGDGSDIVNEAGKESNRLGGGSMTSRRRNDMECPGRHCPGYHVLFGMDYTSHDREMQHRLLQKSLLDHISMYPQSFIVIEEYDKLDCYMRGFFRQILQGGMVGNQSLGRSIIVLESNLGYSVLHRMMEQKGGREMVDMQEAQRALKDMVFQVWQQQGCEDFSDSQKLLRSIDFFLPFYPLEKEHIVLLFKKALDKYGVLASEEFYNSRNVTLKYGPKIIDYLVDKVEFDGKYPIEGGKEVQTVSTGYLSRPYRLWVDRLKRQVEPAEGLYSWVLSNSGQSLEIARVS